jgi:hypothetical protein
MTLGTSAVQIVIVPRTPSLKLALTGIRFKLPVALKRYSSWIGRRWQNGALPSPPLGSYRIKTFKAILVARCISLAPAIFIPVISTR